MAMYLGSKKIANLYYGGVKIGQGYMGSRLVYQSAFNVEYVVDSGISYTEQVKPNASMLSPTTFTPEKSGYTFAGWRKDTTASGSVLTEAKATEHTTLYAVFEKTITASYSANGGSGSTSSSTGTMYYNNGNIVGATIKLRSNGFGRSYHSFTKWAMGSVSGTQYSAGATVELSADTTFYALWTQTGASATASVNRSYETSDGGWMTIPFTGFSVEPNNSEYFTISSDYKYITVKKSCNVTVTWTQTLDGGWPRSALTKNGSTIPTDFIFEVDSGTYTKTVYLTAGTTISIIFASGYGNTSSIGWCTLNLVA